MRIAFKSVGFVLLIFCSESLQGKIMYSPELQMGGGECLWQAYFLMSLGFSFPVHHFLEV